MVNPELDYGIYILFPNLYQSNKTVQQFLLSPKIIYIQISNNKLVKLRFVRLIELNYEKGILSIKITFPKFS